MDMNKRPKKEKLKISLNAIFRAPCPKTMRLLGWINQVEVVVLVDIGSIHNFLNLKVAKRAGLIIDPIQTLEVKIANDDRIGSGGKCSDLIMIIQGQRFKFEAYVLGLGRCEVVLEVQWL